MSSSPSLCLNNYFFYTKQGENFEIVKPVFTVVNIRGTHPRGNRALCTILLINPDFVYMDYMIICKSIFHLIEFCTIELMFDLTF